MRRNRTSVCLALVGALAIWAVAGCDQSTDADAPNDISSRTQTVNLDDPYGGYNTADEKPYFGDPYLAENYGADSDLNVTVGDTDTGPIDRRKLHRFLMITWGNLRADSLVDFATDWSGGLCVENGSVHAVRTIRFERNDALLARTSRQCIEWTSHTKPSFDGVLLELHRMPCDSLMTLRAVVDSLCGDPMTVTFKTGPLTVSFTQEELRDLHKVIRVDEAGNAVAFNTLLVMPQQCPEGFLAGQWKNVENERHAGIFRGHWVSENGMHEGLLRGVYGANSNGAHVFFGKWISENGRFKGLLKGRYGLNPALANDSPSTDAVGWFDGIWFSRQLQVMGKLHGAWGASEDKDKGGFFRGMWAARCPL